MKLVTPILQTALAVLVPGLGHRREASVPVRVVTDD